MNKTKVDTNTLLIVNRHVSKRENELLSGGDNSKIGPISQNLTKTFNSNIYVKFIPSEVTEEEIVKTFSEVGKIISYKISKSTKKVMDVEVSTYQYGYILFEKVEEA
jgi:RNA recognition motif-containing protein